MYTIYKTKTTKTVKKKTPKKYSVFSFISRVVFPRQGFCVYKTVCGTNWYGHFVDICDPCLWKMKLRNL